MDQTGKPLKLDLDSLLETNSTILAFVENIDRPTEAVQHFTGFIVVSVINIDTHTEHLDERAFPEMTDAPLVPRNHKPVHITLDMVAQISLI